MKSFSTPFRSHQKSRLLAGIVMALLCIAMVFVVTRSREVTPSRTTLRPAAKFPAEATPAVAPDTQPISTSKPAAPPDSTSEPLETLAAHDPSRALDLALAETDRALRENLLQTILRAWAGTAPDAAADWALTQTHLDQGLAMAAVFTGATNNPESAVRLAERLSAQNPADANSFGRYLIFSLAQAGHFEPAASFAAASAAEIRTDLLTAAYAHWARQQPAQALQSALKLTDPASQDAAFQSTVNGWAHLNPQELTITANLLPEGADRSLALTTGLRSWIEKDPAAANDWISLHTLTAREAALVLEE